MKKIIGMSDMFEYCRAVEQNEIELDVWLNSGEIRWESGDRKDRREMVWSNMLEYGSTQLLVFSKSDERNNREYLVIVV